MALFKKTTKTTTAKKPRAAAASKVVKAADGVASNADYAHVLMSPRITEKASMHAQTNVITFDVAVSSNKREIIKAVQALYKVTPRAVRIVSIHAKEKCNARTGRVGMTSPGKKAYVSLKEGDTITLA